MGGISPTCLPLGGVERERIAAPTRARVLVGFAAARCIIPSSVPIAFIPLRLWPGADDR